MSAPKSMRIYRQGAPRVHSLALERREETLAILEIDMHSKYCQIMYAEHARVPRVAIMAGEDALHLHAKHPRDAPTTIAFPAYAGWFVWLCEIARYTLRVALVRREAGA